MNNNGSQGWDNAVRWYSDGPISPPDPRTKEGTIILGGGRSGQAVLSVRGTNGTEVVRLDKHGMAFSNTGGSQIVTINDQGVQIFNGNLIITNTNGGTVLDSQGVVSTTNFQFGQIFNGSVVQTSNSNTFADVSGASLGSFILQRQTNVFIYTMAYGRTFSLASPSQNYVEVQVFDSSDSSSFNNVAAVGNIFCLPPDINGGTSTVYTNSSQQVFSASFNSLSAGTHFLKLQMRFSPSNGTNTGSCVLNAFELGYIIYGF